MAVKMAGASDSDENELCKKCNKIVKNTEKAMGCDGFCKRWSHIKCVGMKVEKYEIISKVADEVMKCDECREWMGMIMKQEPGKIVDVFTRKNDESKVLWRIEKSVKELDLKVDEIRNTNKTRQREENVNEMFEQLTKKIEILEGKIELIKDQKKEAKTYAEIVKNKTKKTCSEGVIIKSKTNKDNNVKVTIKNKIKPAEIGAPITYVKNIKNGGIVVKTNNEENNKKFVENVKKILGSEYEIKVTKRRIPTLYIPKLRKNYNTEELMKELCALNHEIDKNDQLRVVHSKKNKFTGKFTLYIQVNSSLYHKIVNKYVNIDWDSILIREDFGIKQCYKCQKYNHIASECHNKTICAKCGEEHNTRECKNILKQCNNCKNNDKYKTNCSHRCAIAGNVQHYNKKLKW